MNKLNILKMDGLGNDFIIIDNRIEETTLNKSQIINISDRKNIGCDQVIFINKASNYDASLKFYNSDGGEISACGNGSRCVAYYLMNEKNKKKISLQTKSGILNAELNNNNSVCINMGQPFFNWEKIPLIKKIDHKNLKIKINKINGEESFGGFALSIGNPHVVFFVNEIDEYDIKKIGPLIENHKYFPEKCNVTFANIKKKNHILVKVWERGAGLTKACGTAACATVVSASSLKLTERKANVEFEEGIININWELTNNVYMTGKVSKVEKIQISI
ncbi:MAG: diaminopimelate epimerase [Candidatus Pelagibacter sp.]|nr:diaminopimelate epimerase [Candidatus Pelagibacter sp.]OUT95765.1 MAG: diaminopimelate epimerase [Gammaproteobacteria bacterium TMED36]|tara:strand:+ start:1941 stop:2768 length:828 start_codon:yes stop_codon:yes gene_type:complete